MGIITYCDFRYFTQMPVEQQSPKVAGRIFVRFFMIFPYKLGEKHENSERGRKT